MQPRTTAVTIEERLDLRTKDYAGVHCYQEHLPERSAKRATPPTQGAFLALVPCLIPHPGILSRNYYARPLQDIGQHTTAGANPTLESPTNSLNAAWQFIPTEAPPHHAAPLPVTYQLRPKGIFQPVKTLAKAGFWYRNGPGNGFVPGIRDAPDGGKNLNARQQTGDFNRRQLDRNSTIPRSLQNIAARVRTRTFVGRIYTPLVCNRYKRPP